MKRPLSNPKAVIQLVGTQKRRHVHQAKKLQSTCAIRDAGLYKAERVIVSKQAAEIQVASGAEVLNFCANNYLGLSDDKRLIEAATETMHTHGFGMSSVRFICGTQDIHKALEKAVSDFLQTDDTILYTSCFDANGGLFETLLSKEDAIISDALNHASIIDGVRLSKAMRYRYKTDDMEDLERHHKRKRRCGHQVDRHRWGVLNGRDHRQPVCDLDLAAYEALVMVDDSHASGFWVRQDEGPLSIAMSWGASTSLLRLLERLLGGLRVDSLPVAEKLSRSCGSVRGLICSPIRSRPQSSGRL